MPYDLRPGKVSQSNISKYTNTKVLKGSMEEVSIYLFGLITVATNFRISFILVGVLAA